MNEASLVSYGNSQASQEEKYDDVSTWHEGIYKGLAHAH
jgi:hypothetical protein